MGKYILIEGTAKFVSEMVNNHLANGWELYGSPFATGDAKISRDESREYMGAVVAQAMIKYPTP